MLNSMNNDIKEILDNLIVNKTTGMCYLSIKLTKQIKDKITNLQEENRQTKLLKERYQLEKEVYKSRNKKAIEYINTHYLNANEPELLNILQGSDKDEFQGNTNK